MGEALILAGGPASRAKLKEILVLTPVTGIPGKQYSAEKVSFDVSSPKFSINRPLKSGEIVWVPRETEKGPGLLSRIGQVLGLAAGVIGLAP